VLALVLYLTQLLLLVVVLEAEVLQQPIVGATVGQAVAVAADQAHHQQLLLEELETHQHKLHLKAIMVE
jgi:hypothetical protein